MVEQAERRKPVNVLSRWLTMSGSPTAPNYPEVGLFEQWTRYEKPTTYTTASMTRVYNELIALLLPRLETQVSKQVLTEMAEIKEAVQALKDHLISRPQVSSLLLNDLGDPRVDVFSPISVILEETEEESVARWPEVRASGVGSTAAEAIANLKLEITDLYFDLVSRDPGSLGKIAMYTLCIFNAHIRTKD